MSELEQPARVDSHEQRLGSTAGLSHLINLEILNLGNNKLRQLTGLELLSELKILILIQNSISSVTALRCLSCNYKLESLDLRGNPCARVRIILLYGI